jgi:RimJ/RimL family protein N-acetyltransferase
MEDLRHQRTKRLDLRAVTAADIDAMYQLNADPRVWAHFPSGVHTSRDRTEALISKFVYAWQRDGLGYWTASARGSDFAGIGGCMIKNKVAWSVYYRFKPEAQGYGYASELMVAAISAAHAVRPDLPICALILEHNAASKRVAEKSGLLPIWRGIDPDNPLVPAIRLIYADRYLTSHELQQLRTEPQPNVSNP